jgi:hypothetical protein
MMLQGNIFKMYASNLEIVFVLAEIIIKIEMIRYAGIIITDII